MLLGTTALKVLDWQRDLIHVLLSKTLPPGPHDVTVKPKEPKGASWLVEEDVFTGDLQRTSENLLGEPGSRSGRHRGDGQGNVLRKQG